MNQTVAVSNRPHSGAGLNPRISAGLRRLGVLFTALGVYLAPFVEWRVSDAFFTASDGFFVLGSCMLLAGGGLQTRPFGRVTPYWLLSLVIMLLGLFIGSVVNGDPIRWLLATLQYGFGFVLLPFILSEGDREGRVILFIKVLLASVFAMELLGILVYYFYDGSYEDYQKIGKNFITGGRRLGAFLGQANWNAAIISMVLPFAIYLGVKKRLSSAAVYVCIGVLGLALVLSASFTGLISTLAVLVIYFAVGGAQKIFKVLAVMTIAGGILFASGFELPQVFQKRVAGAIEDRDMSQAGTYTDRMTLIKEAWGIVDETMIVGMGVDQYRLYSISETPVHNIYLLLWAEGGLLALFGWLLLMTLAIVNVIRVYPYDRQIAALGLSSVATFLIFSTASPHMYARVWLVPLILAMAVVFGKLSNMDSQQ